MTGLDVTEFGRWFYGESWPHVLKPGKHRLDPAAPLRENAGRQHYGARPSR